MANALRKLHGWIVSARHRIRTARKAVVPVVAGAIGLLSIPTLGVDPEIIAGVVLIASTLGVYETKNDAQDPHDHAGGPGATPAE